MNRLGLLIQQGSLRSFVVGIEQRLFLFFSGGRGGGLGFRVYGILLYAYHEEL